MRECIAHTDLFLEIAVSVFLNLGKACCSTNLGCKSQIERTQHKRLCTPFLGITRQHVCECVYLIHYLIISPNICASIYIYSICVCIPMLKKCTKEVEKGRNERVLMCDSCIQGTKLQYANCLVQILSTSSDPAPPTLVRPVCLKPEYC